jgi:hypothetical protein
VPEPEPEPVEVAVAPPPAAVPAEAAAPALDAAVTAALLAELGGLGCESVNVVYKRGLRIAVAQPSSGSDRQTTEGVGDLIAAGHHLAAESGSGALTGLVLVGVQGAAAAGAADGLPGTYLGVETERSSAGQATVAVKKALPALAGLAAGEPPEASADAPTREEPAADEALAALAAPAVGKARVAAFRDSAGAGVLLVNVERGQASRVAAAALSSWEAAGRAHRAGVDKLIVVGPAGTLGLTRAERAGLLVVAAFAPGVNTGLVGTEVAKLAKACNEAAAR